MFHSPKCNFGYILESKGGVGSNVTTTKKKEYGGAFLVVRGGWVGNMVTFKHRRVKYRKKTIGGRQSDFDMTLT